MDDLDRLLTETMHGAADHAPADTGLLRMVHRRSDRYRRRRIAVGLSASAAVLALGTPAVAVLLTRPGPTAPPVAVPTTLPSPNGVASTAPSPASSEKPSRTPTTSPATPASPTTEAPAAGTVTLAAGYQAPAFPYTLAPADGMRAPVVSMDGGKLIALFEATDLRRHADTTITVSTRKPTFATSATETSVQVRGRAGKLRTVHVRPAEQLTLYWQESAGRWIQLATDDTYTPQQVVTLADGLTAASVAVLPPFELDYRPAGLVTDTVTAATMSFRASTSPPGAAGFRTVLRKRQPLAGADRTVGGHPASLVHDGDGVTLRVDVADWDATLEVSVDGGLVVSDADLLRFAAGVHILNRSDPQ
jgi:hypothetical protein